MATMLYKLVWSVRTSTGEKLKLEEHVLPFVQSFMLTAVLSARGV